MEISENQTSFAEIIAADKLTLACFSATWCGPCQTMKPVLKALQSKYGDKLNILKVDVDQQLDVTIAYQIMGVPSQILFRNGAVLWRQTDIMSLSDLEKVIAAHQ